MIETLAERTHPRHGVHFDGLEHPCRLSMRVRPVGQNYYSARTWWSHYLPQANIRRLIPARPKPCVTRVEWHRGRAAALREFG